jgi:hypothetical protein
MSKFHPEAVKAYNNRGMQAVASLHLMPTSASAESTQPENSDAPVVKELRSEDIDRSSYREYRQDHTGSRLACYFFVQDRGLIGIADDAHKAFAQLAGKLSGNKAYRDTVSHEFTYNTLINWLRLNVTTGDAPTLVEYFEAEVTKVVREREIWVPFPVVQISKPFQIGSVTFRRITKEMVDQYATTLNAYANQYDAAVFDQLRHRLQASTAACITVTAERQKAEEIAADETSATIAILRLACPVLLDVYQWAPIDPSFFDAMGGRILTVEDGKILTDNEELPPRMCMRWVFSSEDIQKNLRSLWGLGHELLVSKRNEFQELLLGALIHYSKSILKSDTSERLMYIVTALEALFVSEGEPIVQNLRERLAIMRGPDVTDRLKVIDTVTKVYDHRSKFVHRAVAVADMSLLSDFFVYAWSAMVFVLNNHNKWSTKAEFLNFIDAFKFRGPRLSTEGLPTISAG